jgi:myo-inositol-1(or 4)-monophosphatase
LGYDCFPLGRGLLRRECLSIARLTITLGELESYLEVAVTAARAAGEEILSAMDRPRQARYKGFRDIVTDTDLRAEQAIVEVIRAQFPDHGLRTEEGGVIETTSDRGQQAEFLWYVDPLDGTTNFAHGYPVFCTSLALRHRDETLIGVVYDPLREHLFTAQSGHGAWLNNSRLQASDRDLLGDALVALDWARDPAVRERSVACVAALAPRVATLRTLGSAVLALCSVAAGWMEAYFNLALYDWDVAAAELFIREAGGQVTDLRGSAWHPGLRGCLASNGDLHEQLLTILGGV